tara:strand:+ start:373 stop:582 length:210 start_codon:yes stop_codon:yes gene_type:complete
MSKKKPTAMELKDAVTGIIMQQQQLTEAFRRLDFIVGKYIDFNKHDQSFKSFLEKKSEENEKKEEKNGN